VKCGEEGLSWICQKCAWQGEGWPREHYPGIWALSSFKDPLIRQAIHGLKYYSLHELAEQLVSILLPQTFPLELSNPLLVPVPTSFKRKKSRGYNQAELIAKAISSRTGWEVDTRLLVKTARGSQVGKTKVERQQAGYALNSKATVPNRDILIIDDLCTTGSTIEACRKALGKPVPALVLAVEE
jgi:ComF family protein